MSRWSAEPLRVALTPGEIALARGTRRQSFPAGRDAMQLLPVLDEALADAAWHAPRAEIVLSQHYVRHVLTPPPGKALSPGEEVALVAASLHSLYGDLAADWRVRAHSQPPHLGVLGAAIEGGFAQALDALLTRHGFRQIHIQPLAAVAARHWSTRGAGWWVLAEAGWLSLFGGTPTGWQHVAGMPADAAWHDALADWITREGDGSAASVPPTVWLHGVGLGSVAASRDTGLRWQILPHVADVHGAAALLTV